MEEPQRKRAKKTKKQQQQHSFVVGRRSSSSSAAGRLPSRQKTLDEYLVPVSRAGGSGAGGGGGGGGRKRVLASASGGGRDAGDASVGGGDRGGGGRGKEKQVARKRTSHPPPPQRPTSRDADDEAEPGPVASTSSAAAGGSSAVGGGAAAAAAISDGAQAGDFQVRVRRRRIHTNVNYHYNMAELLDILKGGPERTIKFCQERGLLLEDRPCPTCMQRCVLDYCGEGHPRWVCRRHKPRFSQTIVKGTVFEGTRLWLDKLMVFFYLFAHGITEYEHLQREISVRAEAKPPAAARGRGGGDDDEDDENEEEEQQQAEAAAAAGEPPAAAGTWIKLSSATIRQWLLFCREICFVVLDEKFLGEGRIGGENVVVEIDECKLGRIKHHVGRRVDGHWILGMVEINTGEEGQKRRGGRFRVEICPDNKRDAATLSELIRKHVKPKTTLVTDGWKGYCDMEQYDYGHYTVIHDYNFVDPLTGANTQTIESTWRAMRRKLCRGGIKNDDLALHLCEFLWRRLVHHREQDPFTEFLSAAALAYDPERVLTSEVGHDRAAAAGPAP